MVGHGESSAGSYLPDPTSPIPSHCASIVATSTLRVKLNCKTCDAWLYSNNKKLNLIVKHVMHGYIATIKTVIK